MQKALGLIFFFFGKVTKFIKVPKDGAHTRLHKCMHRCIGMTKTLCFAMYINFLLGGFCSVVFWRLNRVT